MEYLKTKYKLFESQINDIIEKCKTYKIEKYEIDDGGLLTVYGDVTLWGLNSNELPLSFKEVYGSFNISYTEIKNLRGSPEIVHKNFLFISTYIKDFKYCPEEINGCIIGDHNRNLKYFIEFPKYIGNSIDFSYCDLRSLYGCIDDLHDDFYIYNNKSLKSLRYGPKHIDGEYNCSNCGLTSLYGAPKYVGGGFNCSNNNITSLKYSTKYIGGDLFLIHNKIKSFEYFPEYVGGKIYFENTPVYEIWKLFENKDKIEYFNQMKIIKDENKINIKKLNLFLKSVGKEPVKGVKGYINI